MGVLIGTLALALLNASEDPVARNFAYVYALISAGVIIYGWVIYQKRITKIRRRDPGHFGQSFTLEIPDLRTNYICFLL